LKTKEFTLALAASILSFFRSMSEAFSRFLGSIRNAGSNAAVALSNMARAFSGRIRTAASTFSGAVKKVVSNFLNVLKKRVTIVYRKIRAKLRAVYLRYALPYYRHLLGFFRAAARALRTTGKVISIQLSFFLKKIRTALEKLGRVLAASLARAYRIVATAVQFVLSRMHAFFKLLARAAWRAFKWAGGMGSRIISRIFLAFRRCACSLFLLALPIYEYAVYWFNTYHPILDLTKRMGIAFFRVGFTGAMAIPVAVRRIGSAVVRTSRFVHTAAAGVLGRIAKATSKAILQISGMVVGAIGRIVSAIRAMMLAIWRAGLALVRRIAGAWLAVIFLLAAHLLPPAIWLYRLFVSSVKRTGKAVYRVCTTAASTVIRTGRRVFRAIGAVVGQLASVSTRVLSYLWNALAATGKSIFRLTRGILARVHASLDSVSRFLWKYARQFLSRVARAWSTFLLLCIAIVKIPVKKTIEVLMILSRGIRRASTRIALAFSNTAYLARYTILTIMKKSAALALRLILHLASGVRRTGKAFSRTALTFLVLGSFLLAMIHSRLFDVVGRLAVSCLFFLTRNILAWNRSLFTGYLILAKASSSLFSIMVRTVHTLKVHAKAARDLSLIFSPSIGTAAYYIISGSIAFLAMAFIYFTFITISSYLYNRMKRSDSNV